MVYKLLCILFATSFFSTASFALVKPKNPDSQIIGKFLIVNQNEITTSKIAANKVSNTDVKNYAQMMIDEHTQNLNEIKKISAKYKLVSDDSVVLKALQKAGQREAKQLSAARSQDVDKIYIEDMIKDHTNTIKLIDYSLSKVKNEELKAFLQKTRNIIKQHLETAREIQAKLT